MKHVTAEEQLIQKMAMENIQLLELQFTDLFGALKQIEVPVSQAKKALAGEMMIDGSSIAGFLSIEKSDMYVQPDFSTFTYREEHGVTIGSLLCNVKLANGKAFSGDPRSNLIRVLKQMEELGFDTFNVGCEPEFFLLKLDENGKPTRTLSDEAGYFDPASSDLATTCRHAITLRLQQQGFDIEALHHEVAAGQHEIDFKYKDALATADALLRFKEIVKKEARRHGYHATFMAKPFATLNGSGMHANVSLFKGPTNVFYDEQGADRLSDTARQFIAGILTHVAAFSAVTNPTVNSYKRLVPGFEAPSYIAWSTSNRSALIRIPDARGLGTRVEVRSVDPMTNPYLAMAVLLEAGLDGIRRELSVPDAVDDNIYHLSEDVLAERNIQSLPASLSEALQLMAKDAHVKSALGDHLFSAYLKAKKEEWQAYQTIVHEWEMARYL